MDRIQLRQEARDFRARTIEMRECKALADKALKVFVL